MTVAGTLTNAAIEAAVLDMGGSLAKLISRQSTEAVEAGVRLGLEIGAQMLEIYVRDKCSGYVDREHAVSLLAFAKYLRSVEVVP